MKVTRVPWQTEPGGAADRVTTGTDGATGVILTVAVSAAGKAQAAPELIMTETVAFAANDWLNVPEVAPGTLIPFTCHW